VLENRMLRKLSEEKNKILDLYKNELHKVAVFLDVSLCHHQTDDGGNEFL
jgi:hypothetical protein